MGEKDAERDRRARARRALRAHMDDEGLSPGRVASAINAMPRRAITTRAAGRPEISRDTIRRFLAEGADGSKLISSDKLATIYSYLVAKKLIEGAGIELEMAGDPIFVALRSFHDLTDERVNDAAKQLEGTYEFYASSENRAAHKSKYIVRGAMKFAVDKATGALTAEEWQGWEHSEEVEYWTGFYFVRHGAVVIVLQSDKKHPKYYILQQTVASTMADGKIRELQGRMMKIALAGGVFSCKTSFRRNDEARANINVIEAKTLLPYIRDGLD